MKHVQTGCFSPETCDGVCFGCTLSVCKVCGQCEGGLPTECPGELISYEDSEKIYRGELDYRDGKWLEGHVSIYMSHIYPNNNPPVLPEDWKGFE